MCGRYVLAESPRKLAKRFNVPETPDLPFDGSRYNIAPTQEVPIVRQRVNARELALVRWGLVPSWAKDLKIGSQMINARADSIAVKPSFREAFKARRCLVPADGFYEWLKTDDGKQPYYICLKNGEPFAFAGLWERWLDEQEKAIESCTIITTDANLLMKPLHKRMPVILVPDDYSSWLDSTTKQDDLLFLCRPFPPDPMQAYPVSKMVNSYKNQGEKLIEPVSA